MLRDGQQVVGNNDAQCAHLARDLKCHVNRVSGLGFRTTSTVIMEKKAFDWVKATIIDACSHEYEKEYSSNSHIGGDLSCGLTHHYNDHGVHW